MFATLALMTLLAGDTVVIVLDNSGSMNDRMGDQRRIQAAQQALEAVLDKTPPETAVGVLLLNDRGGDGWPVPLGSGGDREAAKRAVRGVRAKGSTPLGRAMRTAAEALLEARKADPRGDHRLLIVSDGEANDSNLVEAYLPQILARGLTVDVIGVAMDDDHSLATRVATYRSAADAAELRRAVEDLVLAEASGTDGAPGESDFEILEGLPDGVARAALEALSTPSNEPLSEPAKKPWFGGGGGGGNAGPGGGGFGLGSLVGLAVLLFVVFRLSGLFAGQRRASR